MFLFDYFSQVSILFMQLKALHFNKARRVLLNFYLGIFFKAIHMHEQLLLVTDSRDWISSNLSCSVNIRAFKTINNIFRPFCCEIKTVTGWK